VRGYVLDANAAIRYFTPEPNDAGAEKVDKLIEDAKNGRSRIWMSVVNLGEVFYILLRRLRPGPRPIRRPIRSLSAPWNCGGTAVPR
jgi:predicted nucleic acid-binding protein